MSSAIPAITTAPPLAAQKQAPPVSALSPTDVSYVDSLMGALPAQRMEEVMLRTGVPLPAHLGQGLDAAV